MTSLFGLALASLIAAIAQVESENGATSDNVYQMRRIYVEDVNRVLGREAYSYEDVTDADKCVEMMVTYWTHYGARYERLTGKPVTYEVLARIHNGGPDGWRRKCTEKYWDRVRAAMEKETSHETGTGDVPAEAE